MTEGSRPAEPGDLAVLVDLANLMREELVVMRGGVIWSLREARAEPPSEAELFGHDDISAVVGTIDDVVIGYGIARVEPVHDGRPLGVISELFVHPDARGVGIGELMLADLVGFLTGRGCIGIDAMALPGHRAAKNFFEQQGFVARRIVMHTSLNRG